MTIKIKNALTEDEEANRFLEQKNLSRAMKRLIKIQKSSWRLLGEGYKSLDSAEFKTFKFDNFTIKMQHNSVRAVSALAKVDKHSLNNRKCFLCYENLYPEQKGILYDKDFLILCNPFPIFEEHFTIPSIEHKPQRIKENFAAMLKVTADVKNDYDVFYNGPECGASAPDHLHFQAGDKFFIPVDREYVQLKESCAEELLLKRDLKVYGIDDGLRRILSVESKNNKVAENVFNLIYEELYNFDKGKAEPPMNIISSYYEDTGFRIMIFLRDKHRPSCYSEEGENKLVISPGAVDMGGVCILPFRKDFDKITKTKLIEIFNEVSFSAEKFNFLKVKLKNGLRKIF